MIIHGDCNEMMYLLAPQSVDMVFCDMPYGTTKNKWDSVIDLDLFWKGIKHCCKSNAALIFTAQVPFNIVLGASNMDWLHYEWIYHKTAPTGHLNAKKMPMKAHENVMVFYDKLPVYNPIKTTGHKRKASISAHRTDCYGAQKVTPYDSTERYPISVQQFKKDTQRQSINATQKPVEMVKYFIETYTNHGALVLDPCAGSGSTMIAAIQSGRKYVMIEKDQYHYEQIKQRTT